MNDTFDDSNPDLSDAALLNRFQSGQEDAATALYQRYAHRLLRLAGKRSSDGLSKRVDADDIVQSVFRTFFRRAATGHYQLPEGEELWKLFLVISLNKIRKKSEFHHAAKRDVDRTQSMGESQLAAHDAAFEVLRLTIDDLISDMHPQHQGVIRDRINGFEVADMAQRNKLSRRTVERVLQGFRQRLQLELEDLGDA